MTKLREEFESEHRLNLYALNTTMELWGAYVE